MMATMKKRPIATIYRQTPVNIAIDLLAHATHFNEGEPEFQLAERLHAKEGKAQYEEPESARPTKVNY